MVDVSASVDVALAEAVFRQESSTVLGALMRQYGDLDLAEDGYQEACLDAWQQWPRSGLPDNPGAWLLTVARRRVVDRVRREGRRAERERAAPISMEPVEGAPPRDDFLDDQLLLLFMCCHPALSEESRIALTLRSVAGLTTAEIARGFLVPEPTMAQRLVRAKRKIAATKIPFDISVREVPDRMASVCHVIYLVFNEGYASSDADVFLRTELCDEAIVLARLLVRLMPEDVDASGLLALMLFHDSRRMSRVGAQGELITLEEQDRGRWDQATIAEADQLVTSALTSGPLGSYKLQAAIAAVHAHATTYEATDWAEILVLYDLLLTVDDSPAARLGRVVAVSMVHGSQAGVDALDALDPDTGGLAYRWHAVRAQLLEQVGQTNEAAAEYREAIALAQSTAEADFLRRRAHRPTT